MVARRRVLAETLAAFEDGGLQHQRGLAAQNLARWRSAARSSGAAPSKVAVYGDDWGEVTGRVTRSFGRAFAVLNMANALVPGGNYLEGSPAQEENMFRRTDCHFSITEAVYDAESNRYLPEVTDLLNARGGRVLLDADSPRVCVRGPEDREARGLGYRWLDDGEVFPFLELRAAAVDLRDGSAFDAAEMGRRIGAQFDTLEAAGVRHAVLSAFGCGAFLNPAAEVAELYCAELAKRLDRFDHVAFAIFAPGYGPDNLTPFREALAELP